MFDVMTYVELMDRGFMFVVPVNKDFSTRSGEPVHVDYISIYVSLTGEEDRSLEITYDPEKRLHVDNITLMEAKKFLVELGCDEIVVGYIRLTELQDPEPEFDEDIPWYINNSGEPMIAICHAPDFAAWLRTHVSNALLPTRHAEPS